MITNASLSGRERSEVHRAETQLADAQRGTSESPVLHAVRPPARVRSIVRPALPPIGGDHHHRSGRRVGAVLPVLRLQRGNGALAFFVIRTGRGRVEHPRRTVDAYPPELAPVVCVVVDEQRDRSSGPDVREALERERRLGLAVDRRVDGVADEREATRHQMWTSVGPDRRQSGHPRPTEPGAHLCRIHAAHRTAGRRRRAGEGRRIEGRGRPVDRRLNPR